MGSELNVNNNKYFVESWAEFLTVWRTQSDNSGQINVNVTNESQR
jgi:hypothetical protein